ncbi:hypothetical protein ELI_2244 [Eubacterium callanderi]|uniref:Uncharacterized protein n=1 Tax=Eubacterium callanderi TaxID=53442 RepID=E3GMV5_9FIRM|nr:hypothetical protein ELI_2244 [Eubacterium callanderi]
MRLKDLKNSLSNLGLKISKIHKNLRNMQKQQIKIHLLFYFLSYFKVLRL